MPTARSIQPSAVLQGAHQSGVNALSVAAVGTDRVLVLSGGDDQALHAALLKFTVVPGTAPTRPPRAAQDDADDGCLLVDPSTSPSEGSRGGAPAAATGAERRQLALEAAPHGTAPAMNGSHDSHAAGAAASLESAGDLDPPSVGSLKGYAAAVDAQTRQAVLQSVCDAVAAGAAASGTMRGCARHVSVVRLLGSCRVANAHASALRGTWTDGSRAVTVGLDQRVRVWAIASQGIHSEPAEPTAAAPTDAIDDSSLRGPSTAADDAADGREPGSESVEVTVGTHRADGNAAHLDCVMLDVREEACAFTQVLEPEDMAVVVTQQAAGDLQNSNGQRHGVLTIAVVGRGTEMLRYDMERRAFLA